VIDLAGIADAFRKGDISGAEAMLRQAIAARPYDAQLSYILSYVLASEGKYAMAADALRQAVATDNTMLRVGNIVVNGFYDAGQAEQIELRLDQYMVGHRDDASALLVRAYVRILLGQNGGAGDDLNRVLSLTNDDPTAAGLVAFLSTSEQ
jgi:Flp pilus assembly protein TadD